MRRYEIEYRVTPTDLDNEDTVNEWKRCDERPEEGVGTIRIMGLDLGVSYDTRVRLVDDDTRAVSEWTLWPATVVEADSGAPPAPEQVRLTKDNCLAWDMGAEVIDLQGFRIRHAPGVHEGWGRAEKAHDEIVTTSPFVLCRVPKGNRTYMVRAVDWDGNESAETVLVADRGDFDDQGEFEDIRSVDESALSFPGNVAGRVGPGSQLISEVASTGPMFPSGDEPWMSIDDQTPMFLSDPNAPMFGEFYGGEQRWLNVRPAHAMFAGLYQWMEYVWSYTVHCGEEGPRAVLSIDCASTAEGWRIQYRVNNPLPMFEPDPYATWFGAPGDPMFDPHTPKPWRPWPGRLLAIAPGQYDFRLIVPGGHEIRRVTRLSVTVSSEARVRHVTGLEVPALGGTRVPPGDRWRRIVEVRPVPMGVISPTYVAVDSKSGAKGPSLQTFQAAGAATVLLDATIRGY